MFQIHIVALLLVAATISGCSSRPRAPALINTSIYQNDEAGFRLEIPEGWRISAKANVTRGEPVLKEKKLVSYTLPAGAQLASLEITCLDMPEGADLIEHFTAQQTGPNAWRSLGPIEATALGDVPAQRLAFAFGTGANAQRKDVVTVRQGGRQYFFRLIASPADVKTRDEIRRVLSRITWQT